MFDYTNALVSNLLNKAVGCFTNWLMLLQARKTLIAQMSKAELHAEIKRNETAIDSFFAELPNDIEKIEECEKKQNEINEWKAAWEREQKNANSQQ